MIQGIAFDLEGTLVDVEEAHHQGHLDVARDLGFPMTLSEARQRIPGFVGGGDEHIARILCSLSNGTRSEVEILFAIKAAFKRYLAQVPIMSRPSATDFLNEVQRMRIPFALGSLTPKQEALYLLRRSGLYSLFQKRPMVFREDVEKVKPDPEVFLRTADALGIRPQEQLVFEDSAVGVEAAVRAGSIVIAVPVIHDDYLVDRMIKLGALQVVLDWHHLSITDLMKQV